MSAVSSNLISPTVTESQPSSSSSSSSYSATSSSTQHRRPRQLPVPPLQSPQRGYAISLRATHQHYSNSNSNTNTDACSDTSSLSGYRDSGIEAPSPPRAPSFSPSDTSSSTRTTSPPPLLPTNSRTPTSTATDTRQHNHSHWRQQASAERRRDLQQRRLEQEQRLRRDREQRQSSAAAVNAAITPTNLPGGTTSRVSPFHGPASPTSPFQYTQHANINFDRSLSVSCHSSSSNSIPTSSTYNTRVPQPLPPDWVERRDKKTGRIFFANLRTRRTSWLDPRAQPNGPSKDLLCVDWLALPYGWQAADDSYGDTFYINHITKSTSWDPPRRVAQKEQVEGAQHVSTEQKMQLRSQEGMLKALRRDIQHRQQAIEELSARKMALTETRKAAQPNSSEQARVEGQLEIINDQIGAEVSKVMQTNKLADAAAADVAERRRRARAMDLLIKEMAANSKASLQTEADLGECLAGDLQQLLRKHNRQFIEARNLLLDLEGLRHRLVDALGEHARFQPVVDAESLSAFGKESVCPHLTDSNQLKTNMELKLDILLISNILLPLLCKANRELQDVRAQARDVQINSTALSTLENDTHEPVLGSMARQAMVLQLSDDALSQHVVHLTDLSLPASFADKLERYFSVDLAQDDRNSPTTRF